MRCILCENLSFYIICKACQEKYLQATFYKRELEDSFFNYSFYGLSEIEELINSKYYFYGDKVFNILASLSFKKFALNFSYKKKVLAIAIDDHTRHDFSHTSILTSSLKSKYISPKYNILKAQNHIKYAGKDLKYRQNNPRRFKANITNQTIILCDDLITTGTTILEAKKVLERKNNKVLFSLTLADAKI